MIKYVLQFTLFLVIAIFLNIINILKNKDANKESITKKRIANPLIFGFAIGYSWETIRLFVISLRNSGYDKDIVLAMNILNYENIKKDLNEYYIETLLIEEAWPFVSSKNENFKMDNIFLKECILEKRKYGYKWAVYRYSILDCFLIKFGENYSHIFSLDIRDVVFQRNPLELYLADGMYLVEETKTDKILLKDNECNLNWLRSYSNYKKIINNKILNSGTVYGSINYFVPFIHQFCHFLKDNYVNTAEQGTLNYIYYSGYFKNINFVLNKNQKDIVLTTGLDVEEAKLLKIKNYTIYNEDGTIPYIVHQYDRYDKFVTMYKEKMKM